MTTNTTILPALRSPEDMARLEKDWAIRRTIQWKWDGDHHVWTNVASGKSISVTAMAVLLCMAGRTEEQAAELSQQHTDLFVDLLQAAVDQVVPMSVEPKA